MKFKISCHLNENVEQEIECDPQLNTKPDPVAHNATRFVTPSRPYDVPWWWTQLNPILRNVFICNVPVSQCSITSLDDKLNRSQLMSSSSVCTNVLICDGVVALQSVLKPIRGDSDYRPTSENNDDDDDDDDMEMTVVMASKKGKSRRNQSQSNLGLCNWYQVL